MRECAQCLADVFDDAAAACPACGAPLESKAADGMAAAGPRGAVEGSSPEAAALPDEMARAFRRQFAERAVHVPEYALRRAEEILASAEDEIRRVTVLMVDLCGFSRASLDVSPDALLGIVSDFYKTCSDYIQGRGGFVVKFVGDAALAVFGAPVAYDHDTENAASAALDIRDHYRQAGAAEERPPAVSIGLATGPIRSGLIETPSGKRYDIVGATVNLAARLQEAAGANEVFLCAETQAALARNFLAEATAPLRLKNLDEAYVAYRLLSQREENQPRRVFDSPFVGRQKELSALASFLSAPPVAGAVPVAHVSGEAGLGKTRLVQEAVGQAGAGRRVARWEASPAGESILLHPVLEWLRAEMGLSLHDTPRDVQSKIAKYAFGRLGEEEADPLLLEYLFGIPRAIEALQGIPVERIQRNVFGLLRQLLMSRREEEGSAPRGTAPSGVILIADDLQWIDPLTARFLRAMAEWPMAEWPMAEWPTAEWPTADSPLTTHEAPLTLILVSRSGATPPISPAPEHLRVNLQPLDDKERGALLEKLAPTDEFLPEIRRIVLSKASGNPLFLEEMTRLVRQVVRNNIELNGEALKNHIIDVIPVSLRELIQSRIDRLDARMRQVLQCASLLGMEFAFSLIEMFDIIREGLAEHLQALRAMRYLDEAPPTRDVRDFYYYFTNGLFRDVAYSTLPESRKERLHGSLARRLEIAFADRIQEYYETLAFHYARARERQKALYYLVKAADRQMGLGGASNALKNYREAIELLRDSPAAPSNQALLARILTRCGRLERALGDGAQADEMLAGAMRCAQEIGNERLALEAQLEQAITLVWREEAALAREAVEAVARKAHDLAASRVEAVALNSLGVLQWQRGEYEEALQAFQSLAKLAEQCAAPQLEADAFNNAGLIYWRWGQHTQALKAFRRALPLRRQANDRFGLCATLMNIGIIQEQIGEVGAARKSYANALRLAEQTGYAQGLAALESNLSNLERRAGILAPAIEHAARAIAFACQAETPALEADAGENMGLALAERGEFEAARKHLEAALAIAREKDLGQRLLSVRLSLLQCPTPSSSPSSSSSSSSSTSAPSDKAPSSALSEINALLSETQERKWTGLLPRAYRVKAQILEASGARNEKTVREYLELARDTARDAGAFFEELDAWRALRAYFLRHGAATEAAECDKRIVEMREFLNRTAVTE